MDITAFTLQPDVPFMLIALKIRCRTNLKWNKRFEWATNNENLLVQTSEIKRQDTMTKKAAVNAFYCLKCSHRNSGSLFGFTMRSASRN